MYFIFWRAFRLSNGEWVDSEETGSKLANGPGTGDNGSGVLNDAPLVAPGLIPTRLPCLLDSARLAPS